MIAALLISVAASPAAPQWSRDGEFPDPETVSAMVSHCGVVEAEIAFSDLFQEDAVTLSPDAVLSEPQIACLARVSFDTGFEVFLPNQFVPLFYQQREAIAKPWNVELARQ